MEPAEVVDAFIAAIERKDTAAAAAMCAEDVSYENVPIDPIVGRAGVEQTLARIEGGEDVIFLVEGEIVRHRIEDYLEEQDADEAGDS